MVKLTDNQQACLAALTACLAESGAEAASRGVWKLACPKGVYLHAELMVRDGAVTTLTVAYSTNGALTQLYKPA